MKYLLVADIAKKWNMSERSVRNYCAQGRVNGACLTSKKRTVHTPLCTVISNTAF